MIVTLKNLKKSHFPLFYKWWNDKELRKLTSGKSESIRQEEINKILQDHLENPNGFDFIITADKQPIGHILIQKKSRKKHFEIYIAIGEKRLWGQGIGTVAIKKAVKWFLKNFPKEKILQLEVLVNNPRAIRCYEKVGFKIIRTVHHKNFSDTFLMILTPNPWPKLFILLNSIHNN